MIKHFLLVAVLLGVAFIASCSGGSGITTPDTDGGTRILGVSFGDKVPSLIAFSRLFEYKNGPAHDLFAMFPDGSHVKRLTDNPADDDYPAFSPNGLSLAFVSNRASAAWGNHDVYRLVNPSKVIQLTNEAWEFDASVVDWAPGYVIAAQQNMLTAVPFDVIRLEAVSPTGKWEKPVSTGFAASYDPCISRDGKTIAFCARVNCPSEDDPGCGGTLQLFLMHKGDAKPTQLTHFGGDPTNPILTRHPSFDFYGTRIVFQTTAWDNQYDIAYVRLNEDGTVPDPLRLTDDPAEDIEPCFDPHGLWIAFATNRDGNYEIYKTWDKYNPTAIPVPNPSTVRLTDTPEDEANPDWSPAY